LESGFLGQPLEWTVTRLAQPYVTALEAWEEGDRGGDKPGCLQCVWMIWVEIANQREYKTPNTDMGREVEGGIVPLVQYSLGG
jgi:hypothetical protein